MISVKFIVSISVLGTQYTNMLTVLGLLHRLNFVGFTCPAIKEACVRLECPILKLVRAVPILLLLMYDDFQTPTSSFTTLNLPSSQLSDCHLSNHSTLLQPMLVFS